MNPILSIVLPNYNHGHFLSGAIDAALAQSYTDFELIIVDDGSTDCSLDIIDSYVKKDQRIKLIRHARNQGIACAVMTGVRAASGLYLHGLSATDCYLPGFLEKSIDLLMQHPHIGLCCTDCGLFKNSPSSFTVVPLLGQTALPLVFSPDKIHKVFKYARFSTPGLCSIVKRQSFLKYGGYRADLHFMCDWYINHQIALFEGAIYIPETLIVFREPEYTHAACSNPHIYRETLRNLTALLLRPENAPLLQRMRKAASLGIICKKPSLVWQHPRLWLHYPNLFERYLYTTVRQFIKKTEKLGKFLKSLF